MELSKSGGVENVDYYSTFSLCEVYEPLYALFGVSYIDICNPEARVR